MLNLLFSTYLTLSSSASFSNSALMSKALPSLAIWFLLPPPILRSNNRISIVLGDELIQGDEDDDGCTAGGVNDGCIAGAVDDGCIADGVDDGVLTNGVEDCNVAGENCVVVDDGLFLRKDSSSQRKIE